jgi:hypothetical protein
MAQYPTTRNATSGYGFQQPVELQEQMFPNQGYFFQGECFKKHSLDYHTGNFSLSIFLERRKHGSAVV